MCSADFHSEQHVVVHAVVQEEPMPPQRQEVGHLVHAVKNRNQVILEVELVHRIRRRDVGDVIAVHFAFGHVVAHLHQVAERQLVDLLVALLPERLVAPQGELDAQHRLVLRHHVRADVLLLRQAVDAEVLVEQIDPVVIGHLVPLEDDVDQLEAAVAQARRVRDDRRRQRRAHHRHQCRQRQRREHDLAGQHLLLAVLLVDDARDAIAVALERERRAGPA